MTGLMLKDIMNLKTQLKYYGIFILLYGGISFYSKSTSFLSAIICVFCAMMPMTAMAYDEKTQWEKFALTMPVSRRNLVISKYLLGLSFIVIGFIVSFALGIVMDLKLMENFAISGIFCMVAVIYMSVTMPLMFRLGTEKSRILMLVVLMVPVGIVILGAKMGIGLPVLDPVLIAAAVVAAASIALIVSIMISIGIYEQKEF